MSAFKPRKELTVLKPETDKGLFKLIDTSGWVYAEVAGEDDAYRFVDCWNACRRLAYPEAHIVETGAYIKRLEQLRKDAVAALHAKDSSEASA